MQTRRHFLGNVATGVAGSLATGRVLSANTRLRLGIIGAGERGMELAREAAACPNTDVAAFADVYSRRLEEAHAIYSAANLHRDYRALLDDKSLDAVLIATPQHLHAEHFVAALSAGRHTYIEKNLAFTVDHAKRMRAARDAAPRLVVSVGHQTLSSGQASDAQRFLAPALIGRITAIRAALYRNTPPGKPQWSRPVYPDMNPQSLDWSAFLGEAPARDFDPHRFANWRMFWDYSGGGVHENLSQQLAFWYQTLGLSIPLAATMTGGLYLWKDGRDVPDTMSVTLQHAEELLFKWDSGFGNSHPGTAEEVLGTHGTILRAQQIRYVPQRVNRPAGAEELGRTPTVPQAHMRNFLDAIRTGVPVACPFETGFRVSVACHMAVESYLQDRTIRWDPEREEMV